MSFIKKNRKFLIFLYKIVIILFSSTAVIFTKNKIQNDKEIKICICTLGKKENKYEIKYKDKCIKLTKVTSNVSMREYDIDGNIGHKDLYILTPCVVFLNDQDKIELIYDD